MEPEQNQPAAEPNTTTEATAAPTADTAASESATVQQAEAQTARGQQPGVSEYRTLATVGYILPFLFFLPLLDDKTKTVPYVRFHANQQLILLIMMAAVVFLQNSVFMLLMGIGMLILQVVNLALLALMIIGAMGAYKGEMKELPYVGHFRILK